MSTHDQPQINRMRTELGQVRGLGAAGSGVAVWWAERVTSVALIPLTLWFVYAVLSHLAAPQPVMQAWMAAPVNTVLLLALVLVTFHHMQLGLRVVLEDYVHNEAAKFTAVLAVQGASALLALACVVAILKVAFIR